MYKIVWIKAKYKTEIDALIKEFYMRFTHDWPPIWNYPSNKESKPSVAGEFLKQSILNLLERNSNV